MAHRRALSFPSVPAAILVIVAVNVGMFYPHYSGQMIFPWDFMGGYHAQGAGWFEDGSILQPPKWFPYGDMGFPAWWAVQSGGWYLPLQLVSWLGLPYSYNLAAVIQVIHVAAAALGVFCLIRLLDGNAWVALVGALTYHFSVTFFANQQHVDIVRGAALLPWLLCFSHPAFLLRGPLNVVCASVFTSQFLIATYPGIIVSTFYTMLVWVTWTILWQVDARNRARYVALLAVVGASGVLIAMLKWIQPVALALGAFEAKQLAFPILPSNLLTLVFRYNVPALAGDLTMQSLWCPPVAIVLGAFVKRRSPLLSIGLTVSLFALAAGMLGALAPELREKIPGLGLSRAQITDWRVPLNVGLALLGAAAASSVMQERFSKAEISLRGACSIGILLTLTGLALASGYSLSDIQLDLFLALGTVLAVVIVGFPAREVGMVARSRAPILAVLILAFVCLTGVIQHVVHTPAPWRTPWSVTSEAQLFGGPITRLLEQPRRTEWPRRPPRDTYGTNVNSPTERLSLRYNRAWYRQEFGLFGYNNLRGSVQATRMAEALSASPDGPAYLAFMSHPSQVIAFKSAADVNAAALESCPAERDFCDTGGSASGRFLSFGLAGSVLTVEAAQPVTLIENEMWYPGWRGKLCSEGKCQPVKADHTRSFLRRWDVPAGRWTLATRYDPPYENTGRLLAIAGLLLSLSPWLMRLRARLPVKKPLQVGSPS